MKASRTWLVWAALAACATVILGAMTWQTRNALRSERDRAAAEARADLQERMRLSLWRMDTLGAALILEEDAGGPADFIRSRLLWKVNGQLTLADGSPAPADLQRAITTPGGSFDACFSKIERKVEIAAPPPAPAPILKEEAKLAPQRSEEEQSIVSENELRKRSEAVDNVFRKVKQEPAPVPPAKAIAKRERVVPEAPAGAPPVLAEADELLAAAPPSADIFVPGNPTSRSRPIWIGEELFLLRTIAEPMKSITGSWLAEDVIRKRLLSEISDQLPDATLVPAKTGAGDGLVLASFPFRLQPGASPAYISGGLSGPVVLSLVIGWTSVLGAVIAAAALVCWVMSLSERRASFVSAVTHELRTPLTTFRLYSEMLEGDAVRPEKRGDYLRVLSREADRLSHLVENVLAFSRIERGSARATVATRNAADLLAPMRERFESRLAPAGLSLVMPLDEPAAASSLTTDSAAIEHILFNLVDNAAKYAASGEPREVRISIEKDSGSLKILVADHGPGIPASERRRIFRAFHKSAHEAAETRPGVGLGLALSRRLARDLGGDLTCVSNGGRGTVFILSLPL